MLEKNLGQRFLIIGLVIAAAAFLLGFNGLRPGNDIAGGVSMIFEIDDTGREGEPDLAERVKSELQERVDPSGVYDLIWRVHGRNRLEVQMPLPPADVRERRDEYARALEALYETNVTRGEINAAMTKPPEERTAAIEELSAGLERREARLYEAAEAFDEYQAARSAAEQAAAATDDASEAAVSEEAIALRAADEDYEDAVDRVLATNLAPERLETVLERDQGSEERQQQIVELKEQYAPLAEQIAQVVSLHDRWAKRTFLDGPADLKRLMRGAGVLSFRILVEADPENPTRYDRLRELLAERGPQAASQPDMVWFEIDDPQTFLRIDSLTELQQTDPRQFTSRNYGNMVVGKHDDKWYVLARNDLAASMVGDRDKNWELQSVGYTTDQMGRPAIAFSFDVVGGSLFGQLTQEYEGRRLGIALDEKIYSAPNIDEPILGGSGTITGDFGLAKRNYLVRIMDAGALSARLKETPISERTLASSLGQSNLDKAFNAGIAGLIVVTIIMGVYYWSAGLIANLALILNIVLVLAAMSLINARITLPGIAGIILTIGMSVDANVLIFERMREEKQRGSSLRMIIKNGYDKAFSTIIDANITTLLTCVILYYVGSEEVKGFGLTLGWGIVISLFTALFVTRAIFGLLLKYRMIKDIKMLKLIGVPNIDWYGKRKFFLPLSAIVIVGGMFLLFERGRDALDVEFRGGVSAEFAVADADMEYTAIRENIESEAGKIADAMARLGDAELEPTSGAVGTYTLRLPGVEADLLAALVTEPLEENGWLMRDGVEKLPAEDEILIRVRGETTQAEVAAELDRLARGADEVQSRLGGANISEVLETEGAGDGSRVWSITTTETNKRLVEFVLEDGLGDRLDRRQAVSFAFDEPRLVTGGRLGQVIPSVPESARSLNITEYLDGAAMYFRELDPPLSEAGMRLRLRDMRLQPDYQEVPWRDFDVIGVEPTGAENIAGQPTYSGLLVMVTDPNMSFPEFATVEAQIAQDALQTEQSLRKVSQFKRQVSNRAAQDAILALALSWVMIIAYLWLRFGKVWYGIGGVAALIHDVLIALAAVGVSGWIGGQNHPFGQFFLIDDFHIDMTIVAAFLTIIGYSINDTIVVFDRIREVRGRLGGVTPKIINDSINQCLSRTIMTSVTTLIVLLTMYIFGGASIRGFNYCMMIGILTGTYSSIAVASPLLMFGMRREDVRRLESSAARA